MALLVFIWWYITIKLYADDVFIGERVVTAQKVALGIDVGVASLGACVVALDDAGRQTGFLHGTSFVYPTPDGAAERRGHRAMRRGYRHKRARLAHVRKLLCTVFDLPADFDGKSDGVSDVRPTDIAGSDNQPRTEDGRILISPNSRTRLRALGLQQALSKGDLARAIMHIAKNRGMRLTRVVGTSDEDVKARKEASVMAEQARETRSALQAAGVRTPGELLWLREQEAVLPHQRKPLRRRVGSALRLQFVRSQVEYELRDLLFAQRRWHPVLTEAFCAELQEIVFAEKEAPVPKIGRCMYNSETEERLPLASDLFQQKRIFEEVNNLRIEHSDASREKLTFAQRDDVVFRLMSGEDLSVAKIKKIVGATEKGLRLSLEGQKGRDSGPARKLLGHAIRSALQASDTAFEMKSGEPGRLASLYDGFDEARRDDFEKLLREQHDREALVTAFTDGYGLLVDEAENAADTLALPRGYAATGLTATFEILQKLKADVIDSNTAAQQAGLVAAGAREIVCERLPYYGIVFPHLVRDRMTPEMPGYPAATNEQKFGTIPNPVVHVALNALRKVVNAILKKAEKEGWQFGRVQIELSREMKKTQDDRDKDARRIYREQQKNAEYDAIILAHGYPASRKNRRKLKLWEAQNRICPYTGETINVEDLFSGKFDIDHVLPRSRTLDDRLYNLLVTHEAANKIKANKSPYEAFSGGLEIDGLPRRSYEQIVETVRRIQGIAHKEKLFRPDAMNRFDDQDDFAQRYKTDTSYIAKTARQYLLTVFPQLRPSGGVETINGFITDELRKRWGVMDLMQEVAHEQDPDLIDAPPTREERELGLKRGKNREDNRHHLLDAAIVACTRRDIVQVLQTLSARKDGREKAENYRVLLPWNSFRDDLYDLLLHARTTHRPGREINGQLHKATNLGVVARFSDGRYLTRMRKRLDIGDFSSPSELKAKMTVDPGHIARLEKDIRNGAAELFWSSIDPVGDLMRHAAELQETAEDILELFARQPTEQEYDDLDRKTGTIEKRVRKLREDERLAAAFDEYRQYCLQNGKTPRRTVRLYGMDEAVIVAASGKTGRPSRTYKPGSNAWLDIFRDRKGKPGFEVIRTIDAMRPGFEPLWMQEGGNDMVLRLFKGDTVRLRTKDGKSRLCIFATNSPGDWEFQPVNLSLHIGKHPARKNFRFRSLSKLMEAGPQLVVCDPLGRILFETPRFNF